MARISGIELPKNKRIEVALTYVFGIGRSLSQKILRQADVNFDIRTKDLTEVQVNKLRQFIEKGGYKIEGELKRGISSNIKRLREIGSYRGVRHAKKLSVRGQRTKTNSRTVRGNIRKTMGSGRKPPAQKT